MQHSAATKKYLMEVALFCACFAVGWLVTKFLMEYSGADFLFGY